MSQFYFETEHTTHNWTALAVCCNWKKCPNLFSFSVKQKLVHHSRRCALLLLVENISERAFLLSTTCILRSFTKIFLNCQGKKGVRCQKPKVIPLQKILCQIVLLLAKRYKFLFFNDVSKLTWVLKSITRYHVLEIIDRIDNWIVSLKFGHSEKTITIWNNLPLDLTFTCKRQIKFCGLLIKQFSNKILLKKVV